MVEVTEIQAHVLRMRFWSHNTTASIHSILVCTYGETAHAYKLNFANGSSREHCAQTSCIMEHAREADARNREKSRARMRILRSIGCVGISN